MTRALEGWHGARDQPRGLLVTGVAGSSGVGARGYAFKKLRIEYLLSGWMYGVDR